MHRFQIPGTTPAGEPAYKKTAGIVSSGDHDAAYFMSALRDREDNLWMVTYSKGVWQWDGKKLSNYPVKDGDENVLLFSIYKDRQGNLWLGTHTAGLYKFNGRTFEKFVL